MVVDDDLKNLELMEARLAPRGYEVITVSDGSKALAIILARQPDLILLRPAPEKVTSHRVSATDILASGAGGQYPNELCGRM